MDTIETDRKPTGYIEIPDAWMEDEETCKKLIDILSTCVATGLPFVEFQKAYQAINPDGFDISSIVYHALPGSETQKHDGTLDEDYRVYMANGAWSIEGMILEYKGTCQAIIRPKLALNLLAWLKQEEPTFIQLVKEETDETR